MSRHLRLVFFLVNPRGMVVKKKIACPHTQNVTQLHNSLHVVQIYMTQFFSFEVFSINITICAKYQQKFLAE